jgi:hypothetical protein
MSVQVQQSPQVWSLENKKDSAHSDVKRTDPLFAPFVKPSEALLWPPVTFGPHVCPLEVVLLMDESVRNLCAC